MTSASLVVAGKTSTKRKSCVLNDGCDMAHSSMRSVHREDCTTPDLWLPASSASWWATAVAVLSIDDAIVHRMLREPRRYGRLFEALRVTAPS